MGNYYNFTERWNKKIRKEEKDKTFSLKRINNRKLFVYETQAIQEKREQQEPRKESSSEQEHKVNALASGAEEGRDKLRKAAGSCK